MMNTGKLLRPLGWLPSSLPVPWFTHWLTTALGWHTQRSPRPQRSLRALTTA